MCMLIDILAEHCKAYAGCNVEHCERLLIRLYSARTGFVQAILFIEDTVVNVLIYSKNGWDREHFLDFCDPDFSRSWMGYLKTRYPDSRIWGKVA